MLSERKKKTVILTNFWGAIIINILSLLYDCLYGGTFAKYLFDVGLTRWGWLPAIGLSTASLTLAILWKLGSRIMRVFIIVISALMLIYDLIWLGGIYFISNLHF